MKDKILTYAVGIVIAAGAYFTGAVTDVGGALKIAMDDEQQKIYCEKLIDGESTPISETPSITE